MRLVALLVALLLPPLAAAGHVTVTFGPPFDPRLVGALTYVVNYGCMRSGQYEQPAVASSERVVELVGLPDVGRCYVTGTIQDSKAAISETSREEAFDFATEEQVPPAPSAAPMVTWSAVPAVPAAPAAPSLTKTFAAVGRGQPISVRITNLPNRKQDWVAVARVGDPDYRFLQWAYVGDGVTDAIWSTTAWTAAGQYEFRLYANASYTIMTRSAPFTVN